MTSALPEFFSVGRPLCAEVGGDIFFPEGVGSHDGKDAKRVCGRCGLLNLCREWALQQGSDLKGVWGATNENEREHNRKRLLEEVRAA